MQQTIHYQGNIALVPWILAQHFLIVIGLKNNYYHGTNVWKPRSALFLDRFRTISICSCGDGQEVHFFFDCFRTESLLMQRWPRSALFLGLFPHGISARAEMAEKCTFIGHLVKGAFNVYKTLYQYKNMGN